MTDKADPFHKPGGLGVGALIDGRYEIIGLMGEGATATVYKARQRHIDRPVAVKVLRASHAGSEEGDFEARFVREAQLSAQIRHPGVVTIHDFGFTEEGRFPYIVMELLEGHDLEHEITTLGALEPQRALRLFKDCLGALAKGHELGIVHRDLKPANLFLSEPGQDTEQLIILDFGIAGVTQHHEGTSQRLTNAGELVGTPCYLAPEYIKSQEVSPALDVYQIGLIMVEALTGHTVVDDESVYGCIQMHSSGALVIPEVVSRSPLGPIIRQAVSLMPAERFEHAGAFQAALTTIDDDEVSAFFLAASAEMWNPDPSKLDMSMEIEVYDEEIRDTGVIDPTPMAPERSRVRVIALALLIIGCVTAGVVFWWGTLSSNDAGEQRASAGVIAPDTGASGVNANPGETTGGSGAGPIVTGDGDQDVVDDPYDGDAEDDLEAHLAAGETDAGGENGTTGGVDGDAVGAPPAVASGDIVVRLESNPPGAQVQRGNLVLGKTPLSLPLEAGQRVTLTLRKRGYLRDMFTFEPSEGMSPLRRRLRKRRTKTDGGAADADDSSMRIIP